MGPPKGSLETAAAMAENRIPANVNHSLRVDAAQGPEILGK
jgi:hypothetical protein